MQKVNVYVQISGDYCAFHEASLYVVYDITNNVSVDSDMTLEELENWEFEGDYSDYEIYEAILVDGEYYVKL